MRRINLRQVPPGRVDITAKHIDYMKESELQAMVSRIELGLGELRASDPEYVRGG